MARRTRSLRSMRVLTIIIVFAAILGFGFGSVYALFNEQLLGDSKTDFLNFNKYSDQLVDGDDETVNFLVVGVDESELMTDVIILVNLDEKTGKINVMQIPRDTYIDDGLETGKINEAYSSPGMNESNIESLIGKINVHFKLTVDHYATITLDAFREIIDIMGGIEMDVPYQVNFDANIGMIIYAGPQTLNGEKSEWFVRYRKGYTTGDIGRLDAQVVFLKALIEKFFKITGGQAVDIAKKSLSKVKTDLTLGDVTTYYNKVRKMGKDAIMFHRVPGEGVSPAFNGYATFGVKTNELALILDNYFRPNSPPVPAKNLGLTDLQEMLAVELANGGNSYERASGDEESEQEYDEYGNPISTTDSGTGQGGYGDGTGQGGYGDGTGQGGTGGGTGESSFDGFYD